jgi:hypothetical protein
MYLDIHLVVEFAQHAQDDPPGGPAAIFYQAG